MKRIRWLGFFVPMTAFTLLFGPSQLLAADTLNWNTNNNLVSADISSVPLIRLLEGVSQLTGWHVYLESNANRIVSAKFRELPSGEALRTLLGSLNFALVPETNSRPRLYVFHTLQRNATLLLQPGGINGPDRMSSNAVPNELLITLKPGANIGALSCLEDAKVNGRLANLNTFRVTFEDEASARAARECLTGHPDVESIESNLSIDRPHPAHRLDDNLASEFNLSVKDPDGECKVIIGLIDTRVDSLGQELDKFLLPGISVVEGTQSSAGLGHGSAMAETMLRSLQETTGGKTSVKILPVDVYGSFGTTTTFDVAQGIQKAINSGANIINLSLGSAGDSPVLHSLITYASERGIIFFSAAGNEPVTTPVYPAAYPEVIAVTAGDQNGQIASYANRGSFVDIMTPGTSLVPFNGQSYLVNGTSTATAYASGIAAGLADVNQICPPGVLPTMKSKLGVKTNP
jgi:hypothetical protein